MHDVMTDMSQVNLDWLRSALGTDEVSGYEVDAFQSTNSRSARILVRYTGPASTEGPVKLFLKMCNGAGFDGLSEVHYYTRDYVGLADAPIPTCYDAAFDPQTGAYHILMEDLSDTHRHNARPTLAYGMGLAQAFGALHAHWWGDERLRRLDRQLPDPAALQRYLDHVLPGLPYLLDELPGDLRREWEPALVNAFA